MAFLVSDYLINKCDAKFMAIMKNTDFINELYNNEKARKNGVECFTFEKNYSVSFKNRNEKDVEHLVVVRIK